jgi:hypothetical protein
VRNINVIGAALVVIWSVAYPQEAKNDTTVTLNKKLVDKDAFLLVLDPVKITGKETIKKQREMRRSDAALILVPIKLPISKGHLIESVKCTSSNKGVLLPADVLQGTPGLTGDQNVQSVTLFLKPQAKGKATVTVEFKFNVFKEPNLQYDFVIGD